MRLRARRDRQQVTPPRVSQPGSEETREAIKRASEIRDDAIQRSHAVEDVTDRLREVRRRNHFAELITKVIEKGK